MPLRTELRWRLSIACRSGAFSVIASETAPLMDSDYEIWTPVNPQVNWWAQSELMARQFWLRLGLQMMYAGPTEFKFIP